jgi:streptogrisin C
MKLHTLSAVTALLAGLATTEGQAAAEDSAPSEAMVQLMQRDFGLSAEQAQRRMAFEMAAPRIETALKSELGGRFGGAWLNAEGTQLIVGVTNEADAELVRSAGAEPKLVTRSLAQLDEVKQALDHNSLNADPSIHAWYVDPATNSVVVEANTLGQGLARAKGFMALAGDKDGALRVVHSAEAPRPLYDTRGGDAFYMGGGRCSVGFSVVGGYVTAGHCGTKGTATQGSNKVASGTFQASSFPGNDYSWVKTNSSWTSRGVVNRYNGSTVAVAGSTAAALNSSVCRSGSTTGWHCGTIQQTQATVNYSQGAVTGLTRTNACAEPGDSGGSWISGSQAQGVTSGGSGDCTSGGTTYFQPVNEILNVYGLSLVRG